MSCMCLVSNTLFAVKDTLQHLLMTLFGVTDGSSPVGRHIYSEQAAGKIKQSFITMFIYYQDTIQDLTFYHDHQWV